MLSSVTKLHYPLLMFHFTKEVLVLEVRPDRLESEVEK